LTIDTKRFGADLAVYVHRYLPKRRARIVEAVRMRRVSTRSGRRYAWTYATSSVSKHATSNTHANPAGDAGTFRTGGGDTFLATSERSTVSAAGDASPLDRNPFYRNPLEHGAFAHERRALVTACDANTFDPLDQFPLHQLAFDQSAFDQSALDQCAFDQCAFVGPLDEFASGLGPYAERSAEHVPEVGTSGPGDLCQGARLGDPDVRRR
jgi:hypothetical protein